MLRLHPIMTALASLALCLGLGSCHKVTEYSDDPVGNFEALWSTLDQHYCFFKYKDIDWDEVGARYRAKVSNDMTSRELFTLCSEMLAELKDGHTNLISPWDISYYRYWDQYPQNFTKRVVLENYLNYTYKTTSGIQYCVIPGTKIGYMYYSSFSSTIGEGNLDYILYEFKDTDGLIIDVRDNGGGILLNVETLVARFISERTYAGAISHKTGPGHDDFSEPYDYYFDTADASHIHYYKPIVILTNRSSFSATNNFVSIMQYLDNVRIVGDSTGGGSGMPFSNELPNGWTIRFSACSITDPKGNVTEYGVEPSQGCKLDITDADTAAGRDPILEKGCEVIYEIPTK